jgi:carbamoyl-phosphate synthase large subunit
MTYSILVTSAGRRTSLLRGFLEACHEWGWQVIAGDCDALAPALYLADQAVRLAPADSPAYIPQLLRIVQQQSVRMIVPTIDTDLLLLAQHASEFLQHGCVALISSAEFVAIARDKWQLTQRFGAEGVSVPKSWLPGQIGAGELPEALFIKPRDGSASQNALPTTRDGLPHLLSRVPCAIIQERLAGPEITVDALLDLAGEPIHFVPRRRIRTLCGESIQGVTLDDSALCRWICGVLQVVSKHGGRGPVTLQAFLTQQGPVLTEVNPRFGGGFPLTLAAGGDYPRWILAALNGSQLQPRFGEYTKNLYMTRYYSEHFIEQPLWK